MRDSSNATTLQRPPPAVPALTVHAKTDRGRVREANEDRYLARPGIGLFAVSDGMGGVRGGQVASRLAVRALAEHVAMVRSVCAEGDFELDPDSASELLRDGFAAARRALRRRAARAPMLSGMGCTLSAVLLLPGYAVVAHVGDSRVYHLRHRVARALTEDHTLARALSIDGLEFDEVAHYAHTLTRAISPRQPATPDVCVAPVCAGDRLLLCTDGLTGYFDQIPWLSIALGSDPRSAVETLVRQANAAGGADNVTVLLLTLDERG